MHCHAIGKKEKVSVNVELMIDDLRGEQADVATPNP
jgi:hypothetical protein